MTDDFQIKELFLWLCLQKDQERSIAALDDRNLKALAGYLARQKAGAGVPGVIRGLLICEGFDRYMKTNPPGNDEGGAE